MKQHLCLPKNSDFKICYFCDNFSKADIYLLDYIKRCISYDYNSYYSFRIAVDKQFGDENKICMSKALLGKGKYYLENNIFNHLPSNNQ